jgi:diguanylate cyclase (GGDEF)-like protein/PAS domain S-box-containing protein
MTYAPALVRRIERLLGGKALGYHVELPSGTVFSRALENRQTKYIRWTKSQVSCALPPALRPLAGQFIELLKIRQGILAPLCAEEESLGLLIVNGSSLTEDDVPAMESFAAQIAISLRHVRLTQRMQMELSARRQAEENLRLQSAALEAAANAIAITDKSGIIQWVNPAWENLTGFAREESIGRTPRIIRSGNHKPQFYQEMWTKILAGQVWQGQMTNRRKDGSLYFEEQTITPVLDGDGNVTHFIAIKQDVTSRKQADDELKHAKEQLEKANKELQVAFQQQQRLAQTDSLTGIHNRRYLFELAGHEFDLARRYGHPLSIIMFDLDHFKEVNDNFGHALGDQMLARVSVIARSQLRGVDLIGRYGGEEFMIVLPMTEANQAFLLAERIHKAVGGLRFETEKGIASITLSAGIAEMIHDSRDASIDDIIRRADEALYAAKQAGRNRTMIFDLDIGGTT